MKYNKLFSYCLKNEKPDNVHQFHYVESDEEPTTLEWENWIAGKLYSNILIQNNRNAIHLDLSDGKDKKEQLRDFFDYHYSKYGDICFLYEIKELMNLFETSLRNYYKINFNYLELVNGMIRDWCKEKESEPILESKSTQIPNIQINKKDKNFKDYLICVEERKEAIISKLHSILDNAKGKRIATTLFALRELSFIMLEVRGKAEIYRALENEFGLSNIASGVNCYISTDNNGVKPNSISPTEIDDMVKILNNNR